MYINKYFINIVDMSLLKFLNPIPSSSKTYTSLFLVPFVCSVISALTLS